MFIRILLCVVVVVSFSNGDREPGQKSVKSWPFELNSGHLMPVVGFGTFLLTDSDDIEDALDFALEAGYRHIDTAEIYGNEEIIGIALKEMLPKHNISRQDIFITSKMNPGPEDVDGYEAVKDSLKRLQIDYIDLYLIHGPATILKLLTNFDGTGTITFDLSKGPKNVESRDAKWRGLVKAQKEGLVKSIGVSNYAVKHLKELLANDHGVKPAVNQILWNPFHRPTDILNFCKNESILVVGYSTLGSSGDLDNIRDDPRVVKIAEKLGKTPAQVLLRWSLQHGVAVIPKATSKSHVEEDIELDFAIPDEDMEVLDSFEQKSPIFDINKAD